MLTRKELESILGCKLTDEQWEENQRILDELLDDEWERTHPLDD